MRNHMHTEAGHHRA